MAFLLKVRWEIKPGMQNQFSQSEKALAEVMLNHPGVICYHADHPKPELSEWVEIYANDDTFASHLDDPAASEPLGELINCCSKVSCRCWGDPKPASKERLKAFATEYQRTGKGSFVLNPNADPASPI